MKKKLECFIHLNHFVVLQKNSLNHLYSLFSFIKRKKKKIVKEECKNFFPTLFARPSMQISSPPFFFLLKSVGAQKNNTGEGDWNSAIHFIKNSATFSKECFFFLNPQTIVCQQINTWYTQHPPPQKKGKKEEIKNNK